MASSTVKSKLIQAGSFLLAGLLLYLALRNVNFEEMSTALENADYWLVLPIIFVVLFSHFLRALRWTYLLEVIDDSVKKVSLKTSFYSVMIGYMLNYVAPRLGEVARSANVAKQENLPISAVAGTVVIERILDVIVLFFAILSVLFLMGSRLKTFVTDHLPADSILLDPDTYWIALIASIVGTIFFVGGIWFIQKKIRQKPKDQRKKWIQKLGDILIGFKTGIMSLKNTRRPIALVVTTFGIWFMYLVMAYGLLMMFHLHEIYDLNMIDAWNIMIIGALGIVVPSPGGTGSYHYITIQAMTALWATTEADAATYAVVSHASQMILYIGVGFICMLLQGTNMKALGEDSDTA